MRLGKPPLEEAVSVYMTVAPVPVDARETASVKEAQNPAAVVTGLDLVARLASTLVLECVLVIV